jgi:uncharacterized protein (TIGR03066 family)
MNSRILTIFLLGLAIIGCKPSDDSSTTTSSTPSTATSAGDKTVADAKPADDSKPAASADAGGNSIIGTWTMDDQTMKGASMEFKDGGALAIQAPYPDPKGATIQVDATYKIDGNKMSFHMVGTKMLPPDGADDKVKKTVDDINKKLANGPKQPDETDSMAWKGKDTFTTTNPKGKVTTYTRKA